MVEVDGVPFIGIDVDFEFDFRVFADDNVFQDSRAACGFNSQVQVIAVRAAIISTVSGRHVHVTGCTDHAEFQFNDAFRSHQNAAGGAFEVATDANGNIESQRDRVGKSKFDLSVTTAGTEDTHVRNHPAAGANNGDRYVAKKLRAAWGVEGDDGFRSLDPYGENQRPRWETFKTTLDAQPFSEEEKAMLVEAGRLMFNRIIAIHNDLAGQLELASA